MAGGNDTIRSGDDHSSESDSQETRRILDEIEEDILRKRRPETKRGAVASFDSDSDFMDNQFSRSFKRRTVSKKKKKKQGIVKAGKKRGVRCTSRGAEAWRKRRRTERCQQEKVPGEGLKKGAKSLRNVAGSVALRRDDRDGGGTQRAVITDRLEREKLLQELMRRTGKPEEPTTGHVRPPPLRKRKKTRSG